MDDLSRAAGAEVNGHPFTAVYAIAARQPDHIAVDDGACRLTYAQLVNAAMALAPRIAAAVPADGLVCLLAPIDARFPVAMLACLLSGRAFGPVDPAYPAAYVAATLQVGRPAAVIAAPETELDAGFTRIDLPAPDPAAISRALAPLAEAPMAAPDAMGLVLFTSGSTGLPKGVALPTRTFLRIAEWMRGFIHLCPADHMLPLQSFCTSVGLTDAYSALACGATLHVAHLRTAGLGAAEQALRERGVTVVSMVPSVLRALLKQPDPAGIFAATRVLRLSGEPVLDLDVAAARATLPPDGRFLITMGASEATGMLARFVPREEELSPGPVPIGLPYPDIGVTLEDAQGNPVPAGEEGLLTIRGPQVAFGYLAEGGLDASQFPPDPAWPGARIMRTGDLFRARADGVLSIIGRADRQVKINGVRVEPGQTESVLRAQPGVDDAAVLARQMPSGPVLIAFAAPAPGVALSPPALRAALAERLPPPQRPSRVHVLAEIPRLAGGKIDQAAMLKHDDAMLATAPRPDAQAGMAHDDGPVMQAVLSAWQRVLGHPPSRPGIAFDDDGGDSLGLLQVILRVERALRIALRPDGFDLGMNAAALVSAIGRAMRGEGSAAASGARVLLLPGVGGLGPALARFRAALAPDLAITALDYGEWNEWITDDNFAFPVLLDRLEAEILAQVPEGPIPLAGYSLGGLIAFLLAQRLRARGREIGFLGLLDSSVATALDGGPPQRPWHGEIARFWQPASRGGGLSGIAVAFSRILASRPAAPLLRTLARCRPRSLPGDFDMHMRLRLNMLLLIRLSNEWRAGLGPLGRLEDVPITLFRCAKRHNPADPPDLGWSAHCAALRVVPVTGDHGSMLKPPHLEGLRTAFIAAVREAG